MTDAVVAYREARKRHIDARADYLDAQRAAADAKQAYLDAGHQLDIARHALVGEKAWVSGLDVEGMILRWPST